MGLDLAAIKKAFFLHILQRSLRNAWIGLGIVLESRDIVVLSLVIINPILLIVLLTTKFLLSYQSITYNSILFYINSADSSNIKRRCVLYK